MDGEVRVYFPVLFGASLHSLRHGIVKGANDDTLCLIKTFGWLPACRSVFSDPLTGEGVGMARFKGFNLAGWHRIFQAESLLAEPPPLGIIAQALSLLFSVKQLSWSG